MGHSNGKITAPINLGDDVYATLGIGAIGIGYDLGYACANTHGKINKWSKKKPVRHSNLGIMTDEQFRSVSYGLSFTEGGNHDYGIFSYSAPNGGSSAPYRLTDFDGYNQNAQTGLGLKNYNITRDIFNDKSNLDIYLIDDTSLITCYDLRDSLLSGYKIRLFITSKSGTGKYYQTTIPVDKQSLKFTVPYLNLTTSLGAGDYSLVLDIEKNGTYKGFFPSGMERGSLKITSNTGITISMWPNVSFTDNGSNYAMSLYYGGSGTRILNLNNQNLLWNTLNISNGSSYTISNDNVFVQFRWPGTNKEYYSYVPLKRGVNLANWSINAGGSSTMNYGCDRSQIPKMTNASESVLLVTTNIVYKHTDGYYHNITNPVILRMKKDSGPTPSSVDR